MEPSHQVMLDNLRKRLPLAEPAAIPVGPRILRRIIRFDRRLPGFSWTVTHRKSYIIERDRLLAFVDRAELGLSPAADLPPLVILLLAPDDERLVNPGDAEQIAARYERLLYHAMIHAQLRRHFSGHPAPDLLAAERRRQIGETEFAEIRSVLLSDELLFPESDALETYIEFVAEYLELRQFAPGELSYYFPGVRDWDAIARIVAGDVDHAALLERLQLLNDAAPRGAFHTEDSPPYAYVAAESSRPRLTLLEFRRYQARAERAAAIGNGIKAAITHTRAARRAPDGYAAEAQTASHEELAQLARRLQQSQNLSDEEANAWREALAPLLAPAADGIWSNEARLLYDLQKVCVEHERGVNRVDLLGWLQSRGKRAAWKIGAFAKRVRALVFRQQPTGQERKTGQAPVKKPLYRPLPILREVLMVRHLRTARRRLLAARVTSAERLRLDELLAAVVLQAERDARDHLRPVVMEVLDEVGLLPRNVPETVGRRKLAEELLDRIIEHSYLNMGDLRDAISKNDLKLPDVKSVSELVVGDVLLQADKKLAADLDGVYRRGAVYLRWPQTLSSLAFGTPFGRFLTQHVAIPFGGAYLVLEFFRYLAHEFQKFTAYVQDSPKAETSYPVQWTFYAYVFLFGLWLHFLIHRPAFRAWNLAMLWQGYRLGKKVLVDLPGDLLHSQLVQSILNSQVFAAVQRYLIRPAWVTALLWVCLWLILRERWVVHPTTLELFLAVNLFLNSPVGRVTIEFVADFFVRAWHEVRFRIFAAMFQAIMAMFHSLIVALERIVYAVDEWLRFRSGDSRISQAFKLVGGVVWFFIGYMVVFIFTLLVEPQINPIKHFPVVTVSHKLILPTVPIFSAQLAPYLGSAQANTLVLTVSLLIPGVFGFLVWELKENWRLYAANRPRALRPVPIGRHGETMLQLLRPGFHSGTLPKAYRALRRALRKWDRAREGNLHHRQTALHHAAKDVWRFVERELVFLFEEAKFSEETAFRVVDVHLATNRIEVELRRADGASQKLWITWDDAQLSLTGAVFHEECPDEWSARDREAATHALTGLLQRSGVEKVRSDLPIRLLPPITWNRWVAIWNPEAPPPHPAMAAGMEEKGVPAISE